jgi:hypothetical protein
MRKLMLVLAASSLALTGCAGLGTAANVVTGGPVTVADQTKVDEQLGLSLTLAYTAAARAAALAISTGLVSNQATIAKIGQLNSRAYAAVTAVRSAYLAANGSAYLAAVSQARAAIGDLLAAVRGPSASNAKASHNVQLADAALAAEGNTL